MDKKEFYELKARYEALGQKLIFDDFEYEIINTLGLKGKKVEYIELKSWNIKDKKIKIPEFIDVIGPGCFIELDGIEEIDLSNVYKVSNSAFKNSDVKYVIGNQLRIIDEYAFSFSKIELFIGSNLTSIHYSAFDGCKYLREIDLSNVLVIGRYAFYDCVNLLNVNFNDNVNIEKSAFSNTGLKEIKLNTKYIKEYAFSNCNNLEKVILYCEQILDYAFCNCLKLKEVYLNNDCICDSFAFKGSFNVNVIQHNIN